MNPLRLTALFPLLFCSLPAIAGETSNGKLSDERKQEIAVLVQQDCGSCHGLTLKGGLGPNLNPERLQQFPRGFLETTILHGRPGTPMPPWSAILTPDEINFIATQLRTGIWYVP